MAKYPNILIIQQIKKSQQNKGILITYNTLITNNNSSVFTVQLCKYIVVSDRIHKRQQPQQRSIEMYHRFIRKISLQLYDIYRCHFWRGTVVTCACLFASRTIKKVMDGFSWNLGNRYTTQELMKFWKWSRTYCEYFIILVDSAVVNWREKWSWEKQNFTTQCEKI